KPVIADTGAKVLLVSVRDLYSRADTILPSLMVVSANRHPCSLSYVYSGTTVSPGIVRIDHTAEPETLSFAIHDLDHPLTEHYTVDIIKDRIRSSQVLTGDTRNFAMTISPSATARTDTIRVTIRDVTASADTVAIIVRYTAFRFEDIPNLTVLLTAAGGVTTESGNIVSRWVDTSSARIQVFSVTEMTRQPELIQNAVNGQPAIEFVRTMVNDNLANLAIGTWANAPFTLFVVFSTAIIDNGRQTLVSSGGSASVDFGITCNGTLGIFNEAFGTTCTFGATANSNLPVAVNRWYVASFTSASGVLFNAIQVQAALNGLAASSTLAINFTSAGNGMLLGSGDYGDFTGGFSGRIATVVHYGRALTVAERQQVTGYLMDEYGIQGN
ncbi:MAG: hypothetical protein JXA71_01730, partial [Chitinispirillaceae bacterium]|nr:hypothetical protein [Chitinispirillaceae bacterium]